PTPGRPPAPSVTPTCASPSRRSCTDLLTRAGSSCRSSPRLREVQMIDVLGARSVRRLPTPALVVDTAQLDQNIRTMADHLRGLGIAFRPHAKTHKSIEVARRQ